MVGVTRLFALSHSNAPVESLIKSYRSIDWLERMAIARNLGLPARLLPVLANDANRFVAEQAAATQSLQQILKQWPDWAIKIEDPWRMLQIGIVDGIAQWDGFAGDTQQFIHQVRRHGRQILALVSGTQSVEEFS